MTKLSLEELNAACTNSRADHPGRKMPAEVYRGETAGGILTGHWTKDESGEGRYVSRFVEHTVEHNFGKPIRCPKKAARKQQEEINARISEYGPGEDFEIPLGPVGG